MNDRTHSDLSGPQVAACSAPWLLHTSACTTSGATCSTKPAFFAVLRPISEILHVMIVIVLVSDFVVADVKVFFEFGAGSRESRLRMAHANKSDQKTSGFNNNNPEVGVTTTGVTGSGGGSGGSGGGGGVIGGKYSILETVGQGTYGRVYRVRNVTDGSIVILKQIPFAGTSEIEQAEILNEVAVMSQIDHPSFITFLESFVDAGVLNIVMELAKGGDLGRAIKLQHKLAKSFEEDRIWNLLIQICQGLKYLHDKRILHRDIKPQNIFLDA